jgi:hypothetical protein
MCYRYVGDKTGQQRPLEPRVRFYSLRLLRSGYDQIDPNQIITQATDWRFFNQLKGELKV